MRLYLGVMPIGGKTLNPDSLSIVQKFLAIAGLNDSVGFCKKHRLYYFQESIFEQVGNVAIYVCEECYRGLVDVM